MVVQLAVDHHKAAVAGDVCFFDLASPTHRPVPIKSGKREYRDHTSVTLPGVLQTNV